MIQIDGIIYSLQNHGGITVYFNELINLLTIKKLDFQVSIESPIKGNISGIREDSLLINKQRILERYRSARVSNSTRIFHSSYYRCPSKKKIPTVLTVHDFVYEKYIKGYKSTVHSAQKSKAISQADAIICVSKSTQSDLLEYYGNSVFEKSIVIHNGVSTDYYPRDDINKEKKTILFVGQRGGYKNFNYVLKALELLPEYKLVCVGGGIFNKSELDSIKSNMKDRVKHLGALSNSDLNILYNKVFCLIYPSSYEGFGIPVLEAMRAGCPVVSSTCPSVLEVGSNALTIFKYLNSELIAEAITSLEKTEFRNEKILNGLKLSRCYSWETAHLKTLETYSKLQNMRG